jgi:hypothetical protein
MLALKEWVAAVSKPIDSIFATAGQVMAMMHIINGNGDNVIVPVFMNDKDRAFGIMREALRLTKASRYVFISEGWILEAPADRLGPELERINQLGLEHHNDRREVVLYQAEDRGGETVSAHQFILRPETGKPTLSPLHFSDVTESHGRGANLFGKPTELRIT